MFFTMHRVLFDASWYTNTLPFFYSIIAVLLYCCSPQKAFSRILDNALVNRFFGACSNASMVGIKAGWYRGGETTAGPATTLDVAPSRLCRGAEATGRRPWSRAHHDYPTPMLCTLSSWVYEISHAVLLSLCPFCRTGEVSPSLLSRRRANVQTLVLM